MKYEELAPISRDEFREAVSGPRLELAARAILQMALHEPDLAWAEQACLLALQDSRQEVKAAAIAGLGHLARIHGALSDPAVIEELRKLTHDPKLSGIAEDALDDIQIFASSHTRG